MNLINRYLNFFRFFQKKNDFLSLDHYEKSYLDNEVKDNWIDAIKKLSFLNILKIFMFVLIMFKLNHLIFNSGGYLDYLKMDKVIDEQVRGLDEAILKNKQMILSIEKIKNNEKYQYRLVRKYLDVYEENEFIILFANNKSSLNH